MDDILPVELKFEVAEHLWHARTTTALRSLALVSRNWTLPAQYFLFRHVQFLLDQDESLSGLIVLLQQYPHLAKHIYELRVGKFSLRSRPPPVGLSDLAALVTLCTGLHSLKIFQLSILSTPSLPPSSIPLKNGHLSLSLMDVEVDCLAFRWLIAHVVGAGLNLYNVAFRRCSSPSSPKPALPPFHDSLETLIISIFWPSAEDCYTVSDIFAICPSSLKSFGCRFELSNANSSMFSAFLREKGRSIQDLRIEFYVSMYPTMQLDAGLIMGSDGFGDINSQWDWAVLSECCPALTTLMINLGVEAHDLYGDDEDNIILAIFTWRYALRLIASASPHCRLTSITIGLYTSTSDEEWGLYERIDRCTLHLVDWKKWDEVLGKFKDLKEVRFVDTNHRELIGFKEIEPYHTLLGPLGAIFPKYAMDHLPYLRSRGLLRFG